MIAGSKEVLGLLQRRDRNRPIGSGNAASDFDALASFKVRPQDRAGKAGDLGFHSCDIGVHALLVEQEGRGGQAIEAD